MVFLTCVICLYLYSFNFQHVFFNTCELMTLSYITFMYLLNILN